MKIENLTPVLPNPGNNKNIILIVSLVVAALIGYVIYKKYYA